MKTSAISVLLVAGIAAWMNSTAHAATVSWLGGSGDWGTAANWSTGALPGADDDVVIDQPGDITVTHSTGTHSVKSIQSAEAFVFSGGTLNVSNSVQVDTTFILSGGILKQATILRGTNGQGMVASSGSLDGVTLASDVSIANGSSLTIVSGLTLVGGATITLNSSGHSTYLWVNPGTQTIGGTGQIVFAGSNPNNRLRLGINGATTLTLETNVTVRGLGTIDQQYGSTLINQGTIQADVAGQTLNVSVGSFTNKGMLSALNGATLSISSATWSSSGTLRATSGGTLAATSIGATSTGSFQAQSGGTINFRGSATFPGNSYLASPRAGRPRTPPRRAGRG